MGKNGSFVDTDIFDLLESAVILLRKIQRHKFKTSKSKDTEQQCIDYAPTWQTNISDQRLLLTITTFFF